jgi:hypothetical protein
MTNEQVKTAFRKRKPGRSKNLISTGESLLSYGWWEVARWRRGEIVIRRGKSYSQTTATKHRSGIYGKLQLQETARDQALMEL